MAEYDDLLHRFVTHAGPRLRPLASELAAALGVAGDDAREELIARALASAYMAGVDAGQTEVLAQAAEQGLEIRVEERRSPGTPPE